MNISSLSIQDKNRLIELSEDLTDIKNRKESLIENADKEIDRMSKIDDMQSKLDEKGSELTSILTSVDAKELQSIIEKSAKLSSEKEEINIKSKKIYEDLEELEGIENSLMEEINKIVNKSKEESKAIFVESLNTDIYIVDKQITDNSEAINPFECEIINCRIELIIEIAKTYRSHINKIVLETSEEMFDALREKVEKYKTEKNNSYDKQLELLRNSFEQQKTDEPEVMEIQTSDDNISKPNVNDNQQAAANSVDERVNEIPIQSETIDTPETNEKISLTESANSEPEVLYNEDVPVLDEITKQQESVVPLSTLLDQQLMMTPDQLGSSIQEPVINNEEQTNHTRDISIDDDYKNVYNKIVRATKEKLNNKIIDICWESFEPRTFKHYSQKNDSLINFDINDFVNKSAA